MIDTFIVVPTYLSICIDRLRLVANFAPPTSVIVAIVRFGMASAVNWVGAGAPVSLTGESALVRRPDIDRGIRVVRQLRLVNADRLDDGIRRYNGDPRRRDLSSLGRLEILVFVR